MLNVSNNDAGTTSFSSVSIIDFEHVFICRDAVLLHVS